MNPFERLLNETVYVQRGTSRAGPYRTAISGQKGTCTIFDADADIREGDVLLQEISAGRQLAYDIVDVSFSNAFHSIPAHFDLKLRKQGASGNLSTRQTVNISNSTGIQVGDHNTMALDLHVAQIVEAIERSSSSAEQKAATKSKLKDFLSHPVVVAVIGNVSQTLLSKL